jgi:hypothetical protein
MIYEDKYAVCLAAAAAAAAVLLVISPLPSLGSASKKIEYLQNDC